MPFRNPISIVTGSLSAGDPSGAHVVVDANGMRVFYPNGNLMATFDVGNSNFAMYDDVGAVLLFLNGIGTPKLAWFGESGNPPVDMRNAGIPILYGESGKKAFAFVASARINLTVNFSSVFAAAPVVVAIPRVGSNFDILCNIQSISGTQFTCVLFQRALSPGNYSGVLEWVAVPVLT